MYRNIILLFFLSNIIMSIDGAPGRDAFYWKVLDKYSLCTFLQYNIYEGPDPYAQDNIATFTVGKLIKAAKEKIWERDAWPDEGMSGNGCAALKFQMKIQLQKWVNLEKFFENEVETLRQQLTHCVNVLAIRSWDDGLLHVKVGSGDELNLQNLIKFGRDFVDTMVLYTDLGLDYWDIFRNLLIPFATENSFISDVSIGTKQMGYWRKKNVWDILTDEESFQELTYKTGAKPHWQFTMNVPPGKYCIIQFCQWSANIGYGQKVRIRYALEQEMGWEAWQSWLDSWVNPKESQICF